MSGSDSPENKGDAPVGEEKQGSQRVLLLLLLLAVALFGYVYFFTGLIKPHGEKAEPAGNAPVVKKPLPPRGDQQVKVPAAPPSAPAVEGKTALQEEGRHVPPAAGPKTGEPTSGAGKGDGAKAAHPPVAASKKSPLPAPGAVAQKTPASAPVASAPSKEHPATPAGSRKAGDRVVVKGHKPAVSHATGKFTLLIGDFVLEKDLKNTERKLRKAGITNLSVNRERKTEPMHRLHVADFTTRTEAEAELQKLRKLTGSAFVLPENGKFVLYAGSYFTETQALKDKQILAQKGTHLIITTKKTEVSIPVQRLLAGSFVTREKATSEAARLAKLGLRPKPSVLAGPR